MGRGAAARRTLAARRGSRRTGRAEERSQTLAAVAAWGTAVDGAGAAVGVRETVEEAVERRWMNLALTSYARMM